MRWLALVVCAALSWPGFARAGDQGGKPRDLVVFHAGSMSVPIREIAKAFESGHPGVRVLLEAAGSRECARKIADLGRPCDVFVSADYAVIESLLIPSHAKWAIKFVRNELAVVYGPRSRRSKEITATNWTGILLDPGIVYGRADPDSDPCGYRSVLAVKLAEKHYTKPGLAEKLLAKDLRHMRPKETDLLALLETGTVDYIFLYLSVAIQHGLRYVRLPAAVNLGDPSLADLYATVSVELTGKTPGTMITQKGEPMVYGVTIPVGAPEPGIAEEFVAFLLDEDKGLAIMERNGQPSVVPAPTATWASIPKGLRSRAKPLKTRNEE